MCEILIKQQAPGESILQVPEVIKVLFLGEKQLSIKGLFAYHCKLQLHPVYNWATENMCRISVEQREDEFWHWGWGCFDFKGHFCA